MEHGHHEDGLMSRACAACPLGHLAVRLKAARTERPPRQSSVLIARAYGAGASTEHSRRDVGMSAARQGRSAGGYEVRGAVPPSPERGLPRDRRLLSGALAAWFAGAYGG